MSVYFFSLAIVLGMSRLIHHVWWNHWGPRERTYFACGVLVAVVGSYVALAHGMRPLYADQALVWLVLGGVTGLAPELWRVFRFMTRNLSPRQWLIFSAIAFAIVGICLDQQNAGLIITIALMVFGIWLIFKKGFKL
jgi:hypothetical protein